MWLLRDEIASSLRQTVPVTAETLEMVANHVSSSKNKPCCVTHSVPLQFVYGPEQSLTHFIQVGASRTGYIIMIAILFFRLCLNAIRGSV